MRIVINLASRPYEDEGRFYRQWGTGLALVVLLTAFMVALSVRHYQSSSSSWESARRAEAKLAELKKEEAQAQRILSEPQNRGTRDQSQFLNEAILRKSFSWTRLMEDLEKVMPAGLRVNSIAPAVDQHNRFTLKLQVEGETRESAIDLLRNMEKSSDFQDPQLLTESHNQAARGAGPIGAGTGVRSDIVTDYVPAESREGGD